MIHFVPLPYYLWVYYWLMACLCLTTGAYYLRSNDCSRLLNQNSSFIPFIVAIIITLYIGLRPISGRYFVDMSMYAHGYWISDVNTYMEFFDFKTEWFFDFVMKFCKATFGDINIWFLVVAIFYIGCQMWACQRLLQENVWMAMLLVLFSYQFWGFGTNGLRNGMASAIMMLALSFFAERNKKGFAIGAFLFLLAMGTHRSIVISFAAVLGALFFVKTIKNAVYIWFLCIPVSLVAGDYFLILFSSLGFDERMTNYALDRDVVSGVFRWDFIFYSSFPVLLAWIIEKKGIKDATFTLLANTYILSNAFWILICRIAYSNRFAYLSWYIYALVLAYGMIRVPVWKDQDRRAGYVLILHTLFTLGMQIIGK